MISITNRKWIADLGSMTCWNIDNRITVLFEKKENRLEGNIKDMLRSRRDAAEYSPG
jgi:hypothetical protein